MSLNKFMHPKNRYKYNKPNFQVLSEKHPEFKKYVSAGPKPEKLLYDFKNPDAVKVFTTCLMKEDFGYSIEIPPDRLVPTLPLRLNYVLWIEDIASDWGKEKLSAIDIGTGGSCIYPLLAISRNNIKFLATESDEVNFIYAKRNVAANNLDEKITVLKVDDGVILEGVLEGRTDKYDFCMCNPPFFADHFEAQGLLSRTPNRSDPKTISTASPQEAIAVGGEVAFVTKMIEESVFLGDKIRVYTSMLGKKSSLGPLKEVLRRHKVPKFATTQFCQGKTMRWGLAWTFDMTVNFPKSEFEKNKKDPKKSLVHIIPTQMGERREHVSSLVSFFKQVFTDLEIHCREGKSSKYFSLMTITAAQNTWIHSRRKRRQLMRGRGPSTQIPSTDAPSSNGMAVSDTCKSVAETCSLMIDHRTEGIARDEVGRPYDKGDVSNLNSKEKDKKETHDGEMTSDSGIAIELAGTLCGQRSGKEPSTPGDCAGEHIQTGKRNLENGDRRSINSGQENTCSAGLTLNNCLDKKEQQTSTCERLYHFVGTVGPSKHQIRDELGAWDEGETTPSKRQKFDSCEDQTLGSEHQKLDSCEDQTSPSQETMIKTLRTRRESEMSREASRPPSQYVLKCHVTIRVHGGDLLLELGWLDGADIQLLHQLMQHLKNRLAARKP